MHLREYLEKFNVSCSDLADEIRMSRLTIARIAYHNKTCKRSTAELIAHQTLNKVTVLELLAPKEQTSPPPKCGRKKNES